MQYIIQKSGGRQVPNTGAPHNKSFASQCQVVTSPDDESQKRLGNSQVKKLEPLHILDKSGAVM